MSFIGSSCDSKRSMLMAIMASSRPAISTFAGLTPRASPACLSIFPTSDAPAQPNDPRADRRAHRLVALLASLVASEGDAAVQQGLLRDATPMLIEPIVGAASSDGPHDVDAKLRSYDATMEARIAQALGGPRGRENAAALGLIRDHVLRACAQRAQQEEGGPRNRAGEVRMAAPPPEEREEASMPLRAAWAATEAFGRLSAAVTGMAAQPPAAEEAAEDPPRSLDESIARLARDYEGTSSDPRPYFLTGRMDEALYAKDCEFSDPFVSFRGRKRFVANLQNLAGGFIVEASSRVLSTEVRRGDEVAPPSYTTKLLVKLQLGLPWSPVLAWPWGVEHVFDRETGLIVKHIERWDVSAATGLKMLVSRGPPGGLARAVSPRARPRGGDD